MQYAVAATRGPSAGGNVKFYQLHLNTIYEDLNIWDDEMRLNRFAVERTIMHCRGRA